MSKKLRTDDIASELASGSVFFRSPEPAKEPDESSETPTPSLLVPPARRGASSSASNPDSTRDSQLSSSPASTSDSSLDSTPASAPDSARARKQASSTDSTPANSLASALASSGDLVEAIYRVVKKPGKQTSYVRVTEREKTGLASILAEITEKHDYKVTETDLIRIATCSALADYAENGMDSMLMRVIVALRD
jgi:hypothetical protein